MKRLISTLEITLFLMIVGYSTTTIAAIPAVAGETGQKVPTDTVEGAAPDSLEYEAARNRELLKIWKDHVRTLTKERDEAKKEIEELKSGASAPAEQSTEVSVPQEPSPEIQQKFQELSATAQQFQQENQALKSQIVELERQAQEANHEVSSNAQNFKQENQNLKSLIATLEEKKQTESSKVIDLEQVNAALKIKITELQKNAQASSETKNLSDLQNKLNAASQKTQALEQENKNLRSKIEAIEKEKETTSSGATNLQSLEEENQTLRSQVESFNRKIETLESQNENLKASLESQSTQSFSADNDDLSSQKTKNQELVEELRVQTELLTQEKNKAIKIQNDLEAAKQEKKQILKNTQNKDSEMESLRAQISQLQAQVSQKESAEKNREESETALAQLESQISALKQENRELELIKKELEETRIDKETILKDQYKRDQTIQKLQDELKTVRQELSDGEFRTQTQEKNELLIRDFQSQLSALQSQNQRLRSSKDEESERSIEDLKGQIRALEEANDKLVIDQKTLSAFQEEKRMLLQQKEAVQKNADEWQSQVLDMRSKLAEKESELSNYGDTQTDIAIREQRIQKLSDEKLEMEKELRSARLENRKLQAKGLDSNLEDENKSLRERLEQLQLIEAEHAEARTYMAQALDEIQEKLKKSDSEKKAFAAQLEEKEFALENLKGQLGSVDSLSEERDDLKRRAADQESVVQDLKSQMATLQNTTQSSSLKYRSLQKDLAQAESDIDDLKSQNELLQADNQKAQLYEEEMARLESEKKQAEEKYETLKDTVSSNEADLKEALQEKEEMRRKLSLLKSQLSGL